MAPHPTDRPGRTAHRRRRARSLPPIRVLVVDDHGLLRDALRSLLGDVVDMEWVGEARDGAEAIDQVVRNHPDVVLMDLSMPGVDGLTATQLIARDHADVRVLVLTSFADPDHVRRALEAGAAGILSKDGDPATIVAGIRSVFGGTSPVSR